MALDRFEDGDVLYASGMNGIVDAINDSDSGLKTSPSGVITLVAGWTVADFAARRSNGIAVVSARLTGGSISGSGGTTIGTLEPGWRPAGFGVAPAYFAASGFLLGVVNFTTAGTLSAWKENTATRGEIRFSAVFPLAD